MKANKLAEILYDALKADGDAYVVYDPPSRPIDEGMMCVTVDGIFDFNEVAQRVLDAMEKTTGNSTTSEVGRADRGGFTDFRLQKGKLIP